MPVVMLSAQVWEPSVTGNKQKRVFWVSLFRREKKGLHPNKKTRTSIFEPFVGSLTLVEDSANVQAVERPIPICSGSVPAEPLVKLS